VPFEKCEAHPQKGHCKRKEGKTEGVRAKIRAFAMQTRQARCRLRKKRLMQMKLFKKRTVSYTAPPFDNQVEVADEEAQGRESQEPCEQARAYLAGRLSAERGILAG